MANLVRTPHHGIGDRPQTSPATKPAVPFGGGRNQAQTIQRGNGNQSQTIQNGTRNQSQTTQTGNRNQAQTIQTGTGNQSQTPQMGMGNQSQTIQNGTRNQAQTIQDGSRNQSQTIRNGNQNQDRSIKQTKQRTCPPTGTTKPGNGHGPGNIATTSKLTGDPGKNPGKPGKTGDNTSATVTQQGNGNTSIIDQSKKNFVKQENKNIQNNITPPAPSPGPGGPSFNIEINPGGSPPPADPGPAETPAELPVDPGPVIIGNSPREPVSTAQPVPQEVQQAPSPVSLITQGINDYGQGNYAVAEMRFKLAFNLLQGTAAGDPALTASALEYLALVYSKLGRTQEAADASERARRIRERA